MNGGEFALHPAPMMDLNEAARGALGRVHGRATAFAGVTTDSRAISAGDLFVALKGERFDGHVYVAEAFRRGAAAAMTSHVIEAEPPIPQLIVDDTRLALGRLAAHWRARFTLPVVALTGSNGKTTVKEMLAAILAAHCGNAQAVLATEGNLNNDIGMPLTLLKLREHHRYAVIEMGMNHAGEIDYLTRIARPDIAIVNNAQRAHVGLLGSLQAIAQAKGEIYAGLPASGIALINADEPFAAYWKSLNAGRRVVTFGLSDAADVHASRVDDETRFVTPTDAFSVRLQVAGEHNVRNAVAACASAYALDLSTRAIQDGLAHFGGVPGRLQRRAGIDGALVIDDSYNANPESMAAAVQVLAEEKGRRVLVMGDMGELGEQAAAMHAEVGAFAASRGVGVLLAVGDLSRHAATAFGKGARHFTDVDEAIRAAQAMAGRDVAFLVKGSRFMRMERVADALAADGGADAL